MKKCTKCNLIKDEIDFYRPKRSSYCKKCHLLINNAHKREKRKNVDFRKIEVLKNKERRVRLWQNALLHDCKARKLEFNIDIDYINYLYENQKGKCYWFGVDLIPSYHKKHPQQPSLDRIDNKKGYIKGNIALCCYSANMGRNDTDVNIWIDFLKNVNINSYESTCK